jgi:CheY-like chemotaxis protein
MTKQSPGPTRVLIIDDERTIADTLRIILRAAGFETMVAYSGETAIAVAGEFVPDIVLADYAMPGINGIETSVTIQRMLPGCRVIMLSGQFMGVDLDGYRTKGYNFLLLSKPIHPEELVRTLRAEEVIASESAAPARILNVDDKEANRYSISRLLAHAGFEVTEAGTGAEALREAIEKKPELVLLDIHLPDTDGYDVCTALKQGSDTAHITVMHVTSSEASSEFATRSAEAGADAHLSYPVEPKALIAQVRELLQIRYLRDEAQ